MTLNLRRIVCCWDRLSGCGGSGDDDDDDDDEEDDDDDDDERKQERLNINIHRYRHLNHTHLMIFATWESVCMSRALDNSRAPRIASTVECKAKEDVGKSENDENAERAETNLSNIQLDLYLQNKVHTYAH